MKNKEIKEKNIEIEEKRERLRIDQDNLLIKKIEILIDLLESLEPRETEPSIIETNQSNFISVLDESNKNIVLRKIFELIEKF